MKLPVFKSTGTITDILWDCGGAGEGKESRVSRLKGFILDNEDQNQSPHSKEDHEGFFSILERNRVQRILPN